MRPPRSVQSQRAPDFNSGVGHFSAAPRHPTRTPTHKRSTNEKKRCTFSTNVSTFGKNSTAFSPLAPPLFPLPPSLARVGARARTRTQRVFDFCLHRTAIRAQPTENKWIARESFTLSPTRHFEYNSLYHNLLR